MNVYNLTLNLDKTQRITNPTVVHRIGDKGGTTIKANIIGGQIYSPIMVFNFENGEEISINGVANGSTITIVLNNRFNDNLGKARCYIKGTNGVSTQMFTVLCVEDIHFTDTDYTWGNSNFENKIAGDMSNPNILARYERSGVRTHADIGGNRLVDTNKFYVTSDTFKSGAYFKEMNQKYYDSLKNDFYFEGHYTSNSPTQFSFTDSNLVTADSNLDALNIKEAIPDDSSVIESNKGFITNREKYAPIARLKVPKNASKVRVNNAWSQDEILSRLDNRSNTNIVISGNAGIFGFNSDYSMSDKYAFATIGSHWEEGGYSHYSDKNGGVTTQIGKIDGIEILKSSGNPKYVATEVSIDSTKVKLIDKDGYIDIYFDYVLSLKGGMDVNSMAGSNILYPQINIDYAYLDLS